MGKLQGRVAVVTGGSQGIGLAIAARFVDEGAYVFITGRRQAELDKAVAAIGKNVTAVQSDVAKPEDLDRLYKQVAQQKGKVDIVVANAGVVEIVPTPKATPADFDKVFDINARGVYFTVQKALPLLKDGASIILLSSVAWLKGIPGYSMYSATKAALRSFVRTWTAELKDRKIRVNEISPGAVETPMFTGQFSSKEQEEETRKFFIALTPLGRLGKPEEIAAAAAFLGSDESSYIAGADLAVDGGVTAL